MVVPFFIEAQDKLANLDTRYYKKDYIYNIELERLRVLETIELVSPLYEDWVNNGVRANGYLPETYIIDLYDYSMPVESRRVTSKFGMRWGRMHNGVDVALSVGDTVRTAFSGKVRIVKCEKGGYGNFVVIRHSNGLETVYAHLSKHLVKENQIVKSGEPIGLGGSTGRSTGPHLHFETRICGVPINPLLMFDFVNQTILVGVYQFNRGQVNTSQRPLKRKHFSKKSRRRRR